MPVIPGSAFQERNRQQTQMGKRPQVLSRDVLEVRILAAYDSDTFARDGIPEAIKHLVAQEPGTMFAFVQTIKSKRKFFIPFMASEAEILKTHGNAVLLKGARGAVVHGRLSLFGEPTRPLRDSGGTFAADVVSFL